MSSALRELRATVRALPDLKPVCPGIAEDLMVSVPSAESWPTRVNRIKDLILTEDPYRFQQWRLITASMMGAGGRAVPEYLESRPNWRSRWLPLVTDDHRLFHRRTALLHAYYIAQLEERTGVCVSDLALVLEFGGGYGLMCHLFRKLGFKGSYMLFDFPVMLALQKFYLAEVGFSATYVSEPKNLLPLISPSLFIATFSLSEAPHLTRRPFKAWALGCNFFLIAYSTGGVHAVMENDAYFRAWRDDMPHRTWHQWKIPWARNARGLVGG